MSKELDQILISTIQKATDATGKVIDFASDQAPDLIHQLLQYKLAENVFGILISTLFIVLYFKGFKKVKEFDEDAIPPYAVIGGLVTIVPIAIWISSVIEAVQIIVAPKVFLLQYSAHLLKG